MYAACVPYSAILATCSKGSREQSVLSDLVSQSLGLNVCNLELALVGAANMRGFTVWTILKANLCSKLTTHCRDLVLAALRQAVWLQIQWEQCLD